MTLDYDKMVRILDNAIVGGPIPENETEDEKAWRLKCEADAKAAKDAGIQLDIPCDWEDNAATL